MSKVNTAREEALELLFPEGQVVFAVIEELTDKDGDKVVEVYTPLYSTQQDAQTYLKEVRDNFIDDHIEYDLQVDVDTEDNYDAYIDNTRICVYIYIKEMKVNF